MPDPAPAEAGANSRDAPREQPSALAQMVGTAPVRSLLERVADRQRESAALLRARGYEVGAQRAQRAASRIDLTLDQPDAVDRMHKLTAGFEPDESLLRRALDGAIVLSGADFGNIQLHDPANGTLRIAVQRGFSREFVDHFAAVGGATSACGRAAADARQAVIVDVDADLDFAPHRRIAAKAGFRSVQSTPLLDREGHVVGVVSTHFSRIHRPTELDLRIMAWYGERLGAAITGPRMPAALNVASATLHERSAERHAAAASLMRSLNVANGLPLHAARMQRRASYAQRRSTHALDRARSRRSAAQVQAGQPSRIPAS